jgi:hypothetical protein
LHRLLAIARLEVELLMTYARCTVRNVWHDMPRRQQLKQHKRAAQQKLPGNRCSVVLSLEGLIWSFILLSGPCNPTFVIAESNIAMTCMM